MKNELISVVVPIYNSEKFLIQCVDSIVNQTYKNLEIILVDDGSTDKSIEIEESYAKKDNRVRIIKQQNLYAGVARNNGIKHAHGKYIIFLDSDDFFEKNMIKESYRVAVRYDAQIVMFGYWEHDCATSKEKKSFLRRIKGVISSKHLKDSVFNLTDPVPWNKLINFQFLKESGVYYQNIKNGNDEYFNRMIVAVADRMVFLNKRFVHYRVNNKNSLQGRLLNIGQSVLSGLKIASELKKDLIDRGLFEPYFRVAYSRYACDIIDTRIRLSFCDKSSFADLYNILKSDLIPTFFVSPDDFSRSCFLTTLYQSTSIDDFLCSQLYLMSSEYAPKSSREYRIGRKIRVLGWRIKNFFRRTRF